MNINNLKLSTVVSAMLILFTALYFAQSFQYNYWQGFGPGAGFAPRWVSGIMLFICIICFFQSFKEEGMKLTDVLPKGVGRRNIIITWLCLIFFAIVSPILGFIITSVIMLTILFGMNIKWYKAIIISFAVSISCFYLFKIILLVPIPVNNFGF